MTSHPSIHAAHLSSHFVGLQQVVHVRPGVVGARKAGAARQQRPPVCAVCQRPQVDLAVIPPTLVCCSLAHYPCRRRRRYCRCPYCCLCRTASLLLLPPLLLRFVRLLAEREGERVAAVCNIQQVGCVKQVDALQNKSLNAEWVGV